MRSSVMRVAGLVVLALGTLAGDAVLSCLSQSDAQATAQVSKQVGTIKSISGTELVLAADTGVQVHVLLQDSTRMIRIAPGEKDLRHGSPIRISDLQVGDRVLVRGNQGGAGQPLAAVNLIVMKRSDLDSKQQHEREEWQTRGIGGIVTSVDPGTGVVTVSTGTLSNKKTVAIHSSSQTILRRYSSDSVKFDDARAAPITAIKAGDQLRARGTRSPDGNEFTAEEIVSGTFRNIAGTVSAVDASAGKVIVLDLASKKSIVVKLTTESDTRMLPPEMAKRVAMRLAGTPPAGGNGVAGPGGASQRPAGEQPDSRRGGADVQMMFNRLPRITAAEMQKGDTVMLVSTQGGESGEVTAINLLDGVEAILAASTKSSEGMTLSPWSLGGQGGEEAAP